MSKTTIGPNRKRRRRIGLSDAAGVLMPAAILATSPTSYFQLRETSGSVADDLGSLANDGAITGLSLAATAGADGFSYATQTADSHFIDAPDNDAYSIGAAGQTVAFLFRIPSTSGANQTGIVTKTGEWRVFNGAFTDRSEVYVQVTNNAGQVNVSKYGVVFAVDTWKLVIARFGASGGSIASVRVNGTSPSMSDLNPGFGSGPNSTSTFRMFGGTLRGALAHVSHWNRQLSDVECQTIEAAADADGWY